jgi:hypothetical protein
MIKKKFSKKVTFYLQKAKARREKAFAGQLKKVPNCPREISKC